MRLLGGKPSSFPPGEDSTSEPRAGVATFEESSAAPAGQGLHADTTCSSVPPSLQPTWADKQTVSEQEQRQRQFREQINGLVYRTATLADADAVWSALLTDFFPWMPIYRHLGVSDASEELAPIRGFLLDILGHGVTLLAETAVDGVETPQLVGVRASFIDERDRPAPKHPLLTDPDLAARHPKASCALRLLNAVSSGVDCLRLYDVDRALALRFLLVRRSHCCRGIGRRLMECSLRLARQRHLPLVVGNTQSYYAEKIYQALGFDRVCAASISDFVDPLNGEKPFAGLADSVHQETVCFAKRL